MTLTNRISSVVKLRVYFVFNGELKGKRNENWKGDSFIKLDNGVSVGFGWLREEGG